jgi:hypothetical protein
MKLVLLATAAVFLTSCGGWSKGQENAFKESCAAAAKYDCDCSLKMAKEKYPNASDFNEKGASDMSLAKEISLKCAK